MKGLYAVDGRNRFKNKFGITVKQTENQTSGWYTNVVNPDLQPTKVDKQMLFDSTKSPFDYLTWFTKLLNLKYRVDKASKTIIIEPIHKYYIDEVIDITDKIDRGSTITINPNTAEHKFYEYCLPNAETYASNIYNKKNKVPYGGLVVDTGYDFDRDKENLFEDCTYVNAIPYRLTSIFFNNDRYPNESIAIRPIAFAPSYTYYLWRTDNGEQEEYTIMGYNSKNILQRKSDTLSPKICCFDDSNDEVDDLTNALLFYDGQEYCALNNYLLSDNMQVMKILNSGNYCHIANALNSYTIGTIDPTNPYYDTDKNKYRVLDYIPIFSKCMTDSNGNYTHSWNFAKPEQTFIQDSAKYQPNITLYERYWKLMINDIYDINAKKVECDVLLKDNPNEALRKFYYFDNSLWILTEISDYSPNTEKTTRCTFIKVKDKRNYTTTLNYN